MPDNESRTRNGHLRPPPNFDSIARPYRWLEYLTMGRALERCRLRFLPQLSDRTCALVLGDGDGRFLAALLKQNSELTADAVDTSGAMLDLLSDRCRQAVANTHIRLQVRHTDALQFLDMPPLPPYDLIATHFFLDCLTQSDVEALVVAISSRLTSGAIWVISDFCIPRGIMEIPGKVLVRGLYLAFRILTGLRTNRLPDYASALTHAGFIRTAHSGSLFGMLASELWTFRSPAPALPIYNCE